MRCLQPNSFPRCLDRADLMYGDLFFARVEKIKGHQLNMQLLYDLAPILMALFTLLPNRVMGQIFFGA